jgi:hypothetical protein
MNNKRKKNRKKKKSDVPVVPAAWKTNRIAVQVSPGINVKPYLKNNQISHTLVAHTCSPSYSGGRDQKDHSSRPVLGKIVFETLS